mmetsp:Transcript_14156/g.32927  ORF Transcript_14156/g.32927 Transcript_14156/m.32927 type:complete len:224 (+) Transcript_14156:363-1034(+)
MHLWGCLSGACPMGGRSIRTIRSERWDDAASSLYGIVRGHASAAWPYFSPIRATYSAGIVSVVAETVRRISSERRFRATEQASWRALLVPRSSCFVRACKRTDTRDRTPADTEEYTLVLSSANWISASKTNITKPANNVRRMEGRNSNQLWMTRRCWAVNRCRCLSSSMLMNKFDSILVGFADTFWDVGSVCRTMWCLLPPPWRRDRADMTLIGGCTFSPSAM